VSLDAHRVRQGGKIYREEARPDHATIDNTLDDLSQWLYARQLTHIYWLAEYPCEHGPIATLVDFPSTHFRKQSKHA